MKTRAIILAMAMTFGASAQAALHDRGGGLIYDDVLDVTWLWNVTLAKGTVFDDTYAPAKLPNPYNDGLLSWYSAMDWVDALEYHDPIRDVIWDDWRLPRAEPIHGANFLLTAKRDGSTDVGYNITSPLSELSYMYYVNLDNLGQYDVNGNLQAGYGLVNDPLNPNDESLFINLKNGRYWYSTLRPDNDTNAFEFRMQYGNVAAGHLGYVGYAWALRDGDVAVAAIPEAETWAMLLAGLGLVGLAVRRKSRLERAGLIG